MEPVGFSPWAEAVRFFLAAVAGVLLVLAVPGVALLPIWARVLRLGAAPGWFHMVLGACLASVAGHGVSHALLILLGLEATFWPMWGGAALLLLLAEGASARWGSALDPPARSTLGRGALMAAAVLLLFTLVTTPPRFVGLRGYWSEEIYTQIANLDPAEKSGHSPLKAGEGLREVSHREYALLEARGMFAVAPGQVPGGTTQTRVCLVLQNQSSEDLELEVRLDGQRLPRNKLISPVEVDFPRPREARDPGALILPALYDPSRQPRNSPPPLRLLVIPVERSAAPLQLEIRTRSVGAVAGLAPVRIVDVSDLSVRDLRGALERRFFVGDTGDIYETLELSRGFRRHLLQHSSSYGGDRHDGGGPTSISDEPPGHHFLAFLALTLVMDQVAGVSVLHLAYLVLLWLLTVHLAAAGNPSLTPRQLVPLLLVCLIYTRLCRLGLESNAPDTLFLILLLAAMALLMEGRRWLASAMVAVAFWVHVPAPHATVLLGLAALALPRRRLALLFSAQTLGLLVLLLLVRYLTIAMAAGWEQAWYTGQAEFLAGNRSGMIKQILFGGEWHLAPTLAGVALKWGLLLLVGSAAAAPLLLGTLALPARARPSRVDPETWVLFFFGILFFFATALLDLHRPHHVGPVIFPLAAALIRRVSLLQSGGARRGWWLVSVALGVGALLFFTLVSGPDPTDTLNMVHLGDFAHVPGGQ